MREKNEEGMEMGATGKPSVLGHLAGRVFEEYFDNRLLPVDSVYACDLGILRGRGGVV